jgi:2-C-methyl-D-erythritol 2,4-cyclodiphosphate synthase
VPGNRVGIGFDAHAFEAPGGGRPLRLGGVLVPGSRGLKGHSDADVILHAAADAIFGALGLPDLGTQFPDTDPGLEGAPSAGFLGAAAERMRERGCALVNMDLVVLAEEPPLAAHIPAMRAAVAGILGVGADQVNLKAKRPEGMGALGRGEGIACQAVVLLEEGRAQARRRARAPARRARR